MVHLVINPHAQSSHYFRPHYLPTSYLTLPFARVLNSCDTVSQLQIHSQAGIKFCFISWIMYTPKGILTNAPCRSTKYVFGTTTSKV